MSTGSLPKGPPPRSQKGAIFLRSIARSFSYYVKWPSALTAVVWARVNMALLRKAIILASNWFTSPNDLENVLPEKNSVGVTRQVRNSGLAPADQKLTDLILEQQQWA